METTKVSLEAVAIFRVPSEIHYLAHTVEEWRYYFDAIRSPAFKLSFTVNHAHLVPEGIAGFVDALDMSRVEEMRLADCFRNGHEVHLKPGAGDIDFVDMFRRIEGKGFIGRYRPGRVRDRPRQPRHARHSSR